eukprot:TRINITY_DN4638_c0_g1_i2.p1 TRINITY_DN4638_c0_g1~~TRINITY_DN4638_c0_g1_i2.p1  ORF type:complete len:219 (-),score=37.28 TRINITY_DN4638_c0_g1_i2:99-731(-)
MADDWDQDVKSDAELLKKVWRNEKMAPEILPFQTLLVERIREQVALVEQNIGELEEEGTQELILSIYRMDLNRTLFLLRSYLRTRLCKIDKHVLHVLSTPENLRKLSDDEQQYAERYLDILEKHLRNSVLDKLPDGYTSLIKQVESAEGEDMIPKPDLNTFVFCKSKDIVGSLQLDDKGEQTVDMTPDDLHILRYSAVRTLVENDRVEFV